MEDYFKLLEGEQKRKELKKEIINDQQEIFKAIERNGKWVTVTDINEHGQWEPLETKIVLDLDADKRINYPGSY